MWEDLALDSDPQEVSQEHQAASAHLEDLDEVDHLDHVHYPSAPSMKSLLTCPQLVSLRADHQAASEAHHPLVARHQASPRVDAVVLQDSAARLRRVVESYVLGTISSLRCVGALRL